jgi:hypothetical protein
VDHHHFCTFPYDGNWPWRKVSSKLGLIVGGLGNRPRTHNPITWWELSSPLFPFFLSFFLFLYKHGLYLYTCSFCGMDVSPQRHGYVVYHFHKPSASFHFFLMWKLIFPHIWKINFSLSSSSSICISKLNSLKMYLSFSTRIVIIE